MPVTVRLAPPGEAVTTIWLGVIVGVVQLTRAFPSESAADTPVGRRSAGSAGSAAQSVVATVVFAAALCPPA